MNPGEDGIYIDTPILPGFFALNTAKLTHRPYSEKSRHDSKTIICWKLGQAFPLETYFTFDFALFRESHLQSPV